MGDLADGSASRVRVRDGQVLIEGANGVILTLTPRAAMQMSDSLNAAAIEAIGRRDGR
jgi:hypothetical protein